MRHLSIAPLVLFCLSAAEGGAGDAPPRDSCLAAVLRDVAVSNPEEVCQRLMQSRDPRAGSNFEKLYVFATQDLGDGTDGYTFTYRSAEGPYAYVPTFVFVRRGDRLVMVFDGRGVPSRLATARPRVNGRYQIERTSVADIPGLYRKREVETWFWNGGEYERAFSRITMEAARDAKLNGVQVVWNPRAEAAYRAASPSWTYRVQAGDTLGAIAHRFGVPIDEIVRQNDIRSAASLRLGEMIRYEGWRVSAR